MTDSAVPYKVSILKAEIPKAMQDKAVSKLAACLSEKMIEKDMATALKQLFDKEHSPTWQCIVGKNFGSSLTFDTGYLLFFQLDQTYALLFKSLE